MQKPVMLYLVRHGLAEERGDRYPDDSLRPLTGEGIGRMEEEAQGLRVLEVEFDEILTSPYTRARQTAEALARAYGKAPRVTDVDALAPGGRFDDLLEALGARSALHSLALVGHEPDIGQLAARLIGARRALTFKKGAVCGIEVAGLPPTGLGTLQWFLPPRMLRRLGQRG
jgi:phosphohistidine phosphatase